jgi:hypothetical protein
MKHLQVNVPALEKPGQSYLITLKGWAPRFKTAKGKYCTGKGIVSSGWPLYY